MFAAEDVVAGVVVGDVFAGVGVAATSVVKNVGVC